MIRQLVGLPALRHRLLLKGIFPFAKIFTSKKAVIPQQQEKKQQQSTELKKPVFTAGINKNNNASFLVILEQEKTFPQLLKLKVEATSTHSRFFGAYLRKIRLILNQKTYQQFKREVHELHAKLEEFSNFEIPPSQFVEILLFHAHLQELQNKPVFTNNFGFQKKAFDFASSQLHNQVYSLNQVLTIYELMIKLDSICLLFLINLIKFLKRQFDRKEGKTIKLEHILTIFNSYLLKTNNIPLQNIICDQTLHYLLTNYETLVTGASMVMKSDLLGALMLIDMKSTYKSSKNSRKLAVLKLLHEIQDKMKGQWLSPLFSQSKSALSEDDVNFYQVVYLLDCIKFTKDNKMEHQNYQSQYEEFIRKVYNSIQQVKDQIAQSKLKIQHNKQIIIRIIFHPQLIDRWIQDKQVKNAFVSLLSNITSFDEDISLRPLVDLIRSPNNTHVTSTLIDILDEITRRQIKRGTVHWSSVAVLLQFYSNDQSLKLMKQIEDLQTVQKLQQSKYLFNLVFMKSIISKRHSQTRPNDFSAPNIKEILHPIKQNESTNKNLVKNLYKSVKNLKRSDNLEVLQEILEDFFIKIPLFTSSIFSLNQNLLISEASLIMTQLLFMLAINKKGPLSSHLNHIYQKVIGNDVLRHQLLASLYPSEFPKPNQYVKNSCLLSQPQFFKERMTYIVKTFDHDKYSYFLWDIMMKNYIKQPKEVRKQSYDLLQEIFMKAYIKEKARKIIHLTVFTNYMCSGVIIASKARMQKIFEHAVDLVLTSSNDMQFHHQCYLQIVVNTLSMNILSIQYFIKIMDFSIIKEKEKKLYCTMMLLMGCHLRQHSMVTPYLTAVQIQSQIEYLRFLIKSKFIQNMSFQDKIEDDNEDPQRKQKRIVYLHGKLVMILLKFLKGEIVTVGDIVMKYLQQSSDYADWTGICYSFNFNDFSDNKPQQKSFKMKFKTIMKNKLQFYKQLEILTEEDEKNLLLKLS